MSNPIRTDVGVLTVTVVGGLNVKQIPVAYGRICLYMAVAFSYGIGPKRLCAPPMVAFKKISHGLMLIHGLHIGLNMPCLSIVK